MKKEELRTEYYSRYRHYKNIEDENQVQAGLRKNIVQFFSREVNVKVMAYKPFRTEVPILALLEGLDMEVFVPEVKKDLLKPVSLASGKFEKLYKMDFIVVPGLFVNASGYRLGRGGGYYDRVLQTYPRSRSVFVCRSWQVLQEIPTDPWDKRVGFLITEKNIRMCM